MSFPIRRTVLASLSTAMALVGPGCAGLAAGPGELIVDNPTIHNLAFRWPIEGDMNGNATARVMYRKVGEDRWREALPMVRVHNPTTGNDERSRYTAGNFLAGSVLDLEPATTYEVRLELRDVDGGRAESTVRVATRPVPPENYPGRRQMHLYPDGYKGKRLAPGFADLKAAMEQARGGDVVLLHAGSYPGNFRVAVTGTVDRPIVFRAAGDGEAVVSGGGNFERSIIEIEPDRHHLYFEGLTVRDGRNGIRGTRTDGLVVRRCRVENVHYGVTAGAIAPGRFENTNWYVADNVLVGRYSDWREYTQQHFGAGINIAGRGHVVCYNRVSRFWDGISTAHVKFADNGHGWGEGPNAPQHAIDIYNNDVFEIVDDGIEADATMSNVRVMRNCLHECLVGVSAQPCMAGPLYLIRNVLFDARHQPWKLFWGASGVRLYHNTAVGWHTAMDFGPPVPQNTQAFNNIFFGMEYGPRMPPGEAGNEFDYNAYNGYPQSSALFIGSQGGRARKFGTLKAFADASGMERHGQIVGTGAFQQLPFPCWDRTFAMGDVDLRLKDKSRLVDGGRVLPNVNEDSEGRAPDIGAYEAGKPIPHYGPRPAGSGSGTRRTICGGRTYEGPYERAKEMARRNRQRGAGMPQVRLPPLLRGQHPPRRQDDYPLSPLPALRPANDNVRAGNRLLIVAKGGTVASRLFHYRHVCVRFVAKDM